MRVLNEPGSFLPEDFQRHQQVILEKQTLDIFESRHANALLERLDRNAQFVVFGVVNAVLLRPLDVRDPQNLYQFRPKPWTSFKLITTSYPAFEDFRQRNGTFSDMAAFNGYAHARLG